MSDQIKPMQPVPEIVHIVRAATHEIERVCDGHGIVLRRIKSVAQFPEQSPHGLSLCEEIMDTLFRAFTEYDKLRTAHIESLKKQNVELLNRLPPTMIFHEDCLTMPPEKESGKVVRKKSTACNESMASDSPGGHEYPGIVDGEFQFTSDCANGCGCWMGCARSGGPDGVDPFGACPGPKSGNLKP